MAVTTTRTRLAVGRATRPRRTGVVGRIVRHRADYLYVAPALLVMLLVIGYPIYYTVFLSFF